MSGIGDLVAHLSVDTSEFVEPIVRAADVAEKSGDRVVRVIHEQQISYAALAAVTAASLVPVAADVGASFIKTGLQVAASVRDAAAQSIPACIQLAASFIQLDAAATQAGEAVGTHLSTNIALLGTAAAAAGAAAIALPTSWGSAGTTLLRFGGIANTVARTFIPQWRIAGLVIGGSLLAYKAATSDIGSNAVKVVGGNGAVSASYEKLKASTKGLASALSQPFEGAASVASSTAQYLIENLSPLPAIGRAIGTGVTWGLDAATSAINTTSEAATYLTDHFTALALVAASGFTLDVDVLHNEAAALRNLAAESARVIALQQSHASAFKQFGDMQKDAAAAAARSEEVTAVSNAKTQEQIEALRIKYQQLFAAQINGLKQGEKLSAGTLDHMRKMTEAIESQAAAIGSGRVSEKDEKQKDDSAPASRAAQAYEQATQALNVLKYGQDEAARMAIAASDATDEEVAALMKLHDETLALAAEQKAQKQTDDLYKQGADRITAMKDEMDLLTKQATKGEIEMRKLARAGFSQEQIEQIGAMTDKIEDLKNKEKETKAGKAKDNKASFAGSSETASLILRGIGGNKNDKMEQYAKEHTKALQQIAQNTKPGSLKGALIVGKFHG